ncbi:MAG: NADH-quinone oxidoreductase subunit A [Planctomycetota bacterium]
MSPTSITAYIVLFGSVGLLFLLVSLLVGRLVRCDMPTPAKREVYECGEPAVGTSFVQFDLRFYVVALVFIVFEVEVALFFPPATIFGTATRWMKPQTPPLASSLEADLGVTVKKQTSPPVPLTADTTISAQIAEDARAMVAEDARKLALVAAVDLAAFFALILLGFAYVWRRGDLNWVRAIDTSQSRPAEKLRIAR